jgi:hypothetical protein
MKPPPTPDEVAEETPSILLQWPKANKEAAWRVAGTAANCLVPVFRQDALPAHVDCVLVVAHVTQQEADTVSTCHGTIVPRHLYHGVPPGWRAEQIVAEHARLGGGFALYIPAPVEIESPYAIPAQKGWLHYRGTVHRLAEGIRAGDAACAELAIRYIELHYIGSHAGYLRARLASALKRATLDAGQRRRLHDHFAALCLRGEQPHEFKEYFRLWRRIAPPSELEGVLAAIRALPEGEQRAARLASRLGMERGNAAAKAAMS